MSECDLAIVGAGAAGLAAAIFAGEAVQGSSRRIVLLEGAPRVGAKILISGGGRCNVTHDVVQPDDFFSTCPGPRNVVRNILRAFDERATTGWFESLGVPLKREETGKLFPTSDKARTVLDALLRRCAELGVTLLAGHRVNDVRCQDGEFIVAHSQGELAARRLIMATGGRSVPKTGSDGHGWEIVRRLGHTVTATYPALAPLVLDPTFFHAQLSGVAQPVELSTLVDGKRIDRRSGNLLWTHFGCSGPAAMDASRFWIIARTEGRSAELRCSFLPGKSFEEVDGWLVAAAASQPRRSVASTLGEKLPRSLAEALCTRIGISAEQALGQLTKSLRRQLVHALVELPLPVIGDRGWNYAEVTAGGVPLAEIDHRTMESRLVPGLYLIGEMLDCDGRIGGFNFQWAWSTGHIAGGAAIRSLL
jgi:predicted Rossmann fold flavoprotein